jgi:DNA invertase Pin-like site-specific DNA recombinase
MKRAAIYLRVSTSNQEHALRQAAERAGWQVAKVYKDHGISAAKERNRRPAFDALCRDATTRQFDVVMAWNVDRLGRRPCGVPVRASRGAVEFRSAAVAHRVCDRVKLLGPSSFS